MVGREYVHVTPTHKKCATQCGRFSVPWCSVAAMGIPVRATLIGELHCLSEDGLVVITAQQWRDPAAPAERPLHWLRLIRNGKVRQTIQYGGPRRYGEMVAFWNGLAERYRPTRLDSNQMWSTLSRLTGIEQGQCASSSCNGRLPVGGGRCLACGRNERTVASGSLSGVRRRGALILNTRKTR